MYIDWQKRILNLKIVYYGPPLSGKTTNLKQIYARMDPDRRGTLVTLDTYQERTLYFDSLQIKLGTIAGMTPKLHLYTVPGQSYYEATRRLVLRDTDGIVFVADSAADRLKANLAAWDDMIQHLDSHDVTLSDVPYVIQFNKRDLPTALPTRSLCTAFDSDNSLIIESTAIDGEGVIQTLKHISNAFSDAFEGASIAIEERHTPMQGTLDDMSVADLIQHACREGKTAQLAIERNDEQAMMYFDAGAIVHATVDDIDGERAVYQTLDWNDGTFRITPDTDAPAHTIRRDWWELLLEGARRLDERSNETHHISQEETPVATTRRSSSQQGSGSSSQSQQKRGDQLAQALSDLLAESADIEGVAVVGTDGLVYSANVPHRELDEEMVGAAAAAAHDASRRSYEQLRPGDLNQVLIQGEEGNIIVRAINKNVLLVGITQATVNLGMAFAEVRQMGDTIRSIM